MAANSPLVAVVTGATRGIGRAIVEGICAAAAGETTIYALTRSATTYPTPNHPANSTVTLKFAQLDLAEPQAILDLAARVGKEQGKCDVLINNAGVYYLKPEVTVEEQRHTIETNYRGTQLMCRAFLPLMTPGTGRIVNVCSVNGLLKRWFSDERGAYFGANSDSVKDVDHLVAEYLALVSAGRAVQQGWPPNAYAVSKSATIAMTRALARENSSLFINSCCPGWVDTGLGSQAGKPPKTPEQGAQIPLRLGFGNIGQVSGEFWANASTSEPGEGRVASWVDNSPKVADLRA